MDKKSIAGIVVVSLLFVAFAIFNSRQQREYQEKLKAYQEYVASQQQSEQPTAEATPSGDVTPNRVVRSEDPITSQLAMMDTTPADTIRVENSVFALDFTTRGAQICNVELKDYTRYSEGERTELVKMFVPETAIFDLGFWVESNNASVKINTADALFEALPVVVGENGEQHLTMLFKLNYNGGVIRYDYTIYNTGDPARDYLIDLNVVTENLDWMKRDEPYAEVEWLNTTYQNEKGYTNENMYSTLAYRLPNEGDIEDLGMSEDIESEEIDEPVNWVGFKQQFFTSALIVPENMNKTYVEFESQKEGSGLMKSYVLRADIPFNRESLSAEMSFYYGPNKYAILKDVKGADGESLAMERLIPLGWGIFGWVNRWFVIPIFDFLRNYIGNFGIIILILALLVKIIIFPMTYKSYVSTAKMRVIKPQIDALAEKYPKQEDAMKRQQATMDLYKKAGINPMGGCIPMLIQMPILIAMFRFFPASIELRGESFLWADDLSSYDSVLNLPFNIPFYGDHVSLFALLMTLALFIFSWINYQQTSSAQPQMAGMKFMMLYMMPLMMLFWFNSYASGLCFYYFLSNLITIAQSTAIRYMVDDDKILSIMEANAAKNKNRKKSKFQLRYEELMREQEMQQRKNRK